MPQWIRRISLNRFGRAAKVTAVLGCVVVASVTIAQQKKADPLVKELEVFVAQVDQAFLPKDTREESLLFILQPNKDQTRSLQSAEIIRLQDQFLAFKKRVEAKSAERKNLSVDHASIESLAEVAAGYLKQQSRLVANLLRLAHGEIGAEQRYTIHHYDYLNLELYRNVGLELVQNKELKLYLNVKTLKNEVRASYEKVQLLLTPQDKEQLEHAVLMEARGKRNIDGTLKYDTEGSYAKLVLFGATRSRISNHYSLQRLDSSSRLQDPELNGCGEHFLSFRASGVQSKNYFDSLKSNDEADLLVAAMKRGFLTQRTHALPLLAAPEYGQILLSLLTQNPSWGSVKLTLVDSKKVAIGEEDAWIQKHILHEVAPKNVEVVEVQWKKMAEAALLNSSYPADDMSVAAIVDRMSWVAWEQKRTLLETSLKGQARTLDASNLLFTESELESAVQGALNKYLDQNAQNQWRQKFRAQLRVYFESVSHAGEVASEAQKRWKDFIDPIFPQARRAVQAHWIKKQGDDIRKAQVEKLVDQAWRADPNSFNTRWSHLVLNAVKAATPELARIGRPTQYYGALNTLKKEQTGGMAIPAKHLISTRLEPQRPEELSQYYRKKLEFWAKQEQFPLLQQRAQKIQKSLAVQQAMAVFFGQLGDEHHKGCTTLLAAGAGTNGKLDGATEGSTLIKSFSPAFQMAAQAFESLVSNDTRATPTPSPIPAGISFRLPPAVASSTAIKKPVVSNLDPPSAYVAPVRRAEARELFEDSFALIGLSIPSFGEPSSELVTSPLNVASFSKLESLFDMTAPEKNLGARIARSVLDQQILADVIFGATLSQHPVLAIQLENKSKAPNTLETLAQAHSLQSLPSVDQVTAAVKRALTAAVQNQVGLVQDACNAKPFVVYNEEWRNVFRSSAGLRGQLKATFPHFEKADQSLMKSTRTYWEYILEDYLDPAAQAFFYATMVAAVIGLGVTGVGAGAGMLAFGRVLGWKLGAQGIWGAVANGLKLGQMASGLGTVAQSFTGKLAGKFIGKSIFYLFGIQLSVMGYVNLLQLPQHLRYQLASANSEIGLLTKVTSDRKEIRAYADQLHTKKVWTGVGIALQAFFVKPLVNDLKALTASRTQTGALTRLGKAPGAEATALEMSSKSLGEWIAEKGTLEGSRAWFQQSIQSFKANLHFSPVAATATREQAVQLMQKNLKPMFGSPELYQQLVEARIQSINRLGSIAKEQVIKSKTNPTHAQDWMNWLKGKIAKHLIQGQYWNVAMSEAAKQAVQLQLRQGGYWVTGQSAHVWEFTLRAYMLDLAQTREYWRVRLQVLQSLQDDVAQGASQSDLLELMLKTFSESDIQMHQGLLDWSLVQASGGEIPALIRKALGTTEEIRQFKQVFNDYHTLMREIHGFAPKVSPAAGASAGEAAATGAGAAPSGGCGACEISGFAQNEAVSDAARLLEDGGATAKPKRQDSGTPEDVLFVDIDPETGLPVVKAKSGVKKPSWIQMTKAKAGWIEQ